MKSLHSPKCAIKNTSWRVLQEVSCTRTWWNALQPQKDSSSTDYHKDVNRRNCRPSIRFISWVHWMEKKQVHTEHTLARQKTLFHLSKNLFFQTQPGTQKERAAQRSRSVGQEGTHQAWSTRPLGSRRDDLPLAYKPKTLR